MKVLEERKIVWCEGDDRMILIVKEDDKIIGINYCQGEVDLEFFKVYYDDIDKDLTDFYNAVSDYLVGETEIDRVNQAIWAHFEYNNNRNQ